MNLYFDGHCILCNSFVRLFYFLDRKKKFTFISLQSAYAKSHLPSEYIEEQDSLVFQTPSKIYIKSEAVLRALIRAHFICYPLAIFLIIPCFFRDILYDLIAKNRYKCFGKQEVCKLGERVDSTRFII